MPKIMDEGYFKHFIKHLAGRKNLSCKHKLGVVVPNPRQISNQEPNHNPSQQKTSY